jgi:signal transduction histidine kinase
LVNLNELIEELSLLVRHKLRNQNIQLTQKLAGNLPQIMADATQLEQAFLNLMLNASEAMPEGGRLLVTSRALRIPRTCDRPTHVMVEFSDSGVGMTEEQRRRAFSSVLSTTKARGNGLGLAIVGRVVETHHGKLKIRSAPGHGTSISITLPV